MRLILSTAVFLLIMFLLVLSSWFFIPDQFVRMLAIALLSGLVVAHLFWGNVIPGRVIRVSDGDTILIEDRWRNRHTVRLAGIDAPEKQQDYGITAWMELDKLICDQVVEVQRVGSDRYGRMVGVVYFKNQNINLWMIQQGHAWYYSSYSRFLTAGGKQRWQAAETTARQRRLGLWRNSRPINPAQYRSGRA